MLPAALAVALSPFPLIGIVLILSGSQGRRNGLLFAAGWITGLAIVATLVAVLFGGADDPDRALSRWRMAWEDLRVDHGGGDRPWGARRRRTRGTGTRWRSSPTACGCTSASRSVSARSRN
ncbi:MULTISPECIES: GAP family protein [unclassified Streptomyces]|uniref:GAP family protein n=1 Tax=unclassified Streptomyces TaxID=2593676 RepID=UPI00386C1F78